MIFLLVLSKEALRFLQIEELALSYTAHADAAV
jgi:hypothetical protein